MKYKLMPKPYGHRRAPAEKQVHPVQSKDILADIKYNSRAIVHNVVYLTDVEQLNFDESLLACDGDVSSHSYRIYEAQPDVVYIIAWVDF